mmetsp:Transcript_53689/g.127053  ORF Transcript_53689/g.127053 Transcript_53689/m.127053 type:complete len:220 (-) Transcript_53689:321-980(-)
MSWMFSRTSSSSFSGSGTPKQQTRRTSSWSWARCKRTSRLFWTSISSSRAKRPPPRWCISGQRFSSTTPLAFSTTSLWWLRVWRVTRVRARRSFTASVYGRGRQRVRRRGGWLPCSASLGRMVALLARCAVREPGRSFSWTLSSKPTSTSERSPATTQASRTGRSALKQPSEKHTPLEADRRGRSSKPPSPQATHDSSSPSPASARRGRRGGTSQCLRR